MTNLNKDQLQKMFLSALLMLGLVYSYFTFLIGPLGKTDTAHTTAIEALDGEIAKAQTTVKRSKSVQEQARTAEELLAQVNDMVPEGAPIAWFPPRMHAFFERHNLKGVTVRPGALDGAADPLVNNLRGAEWNIDIPSAGIAQLGIVLAGLENEEKLLEITRLSISTQADAPEKQHTSLTIATLLK